MKTNTPLIVKGSDYLIKNIDTENKGLNNISIVGLGDNARLKTNQLHFKDIPFLTITGITLAFAHKTPLFRSFNVTH